MFKKLGYKTVLVLYRYMHELILFLQEKCALTHNYQPNPFGMQQGGRDTHDRFDKIIASIDLPHSMVDLGCNRGFFVLKTAQRGCFSIGVDNDKSEIIAARSTAEKHNISKALFMCHNIDSDFVKLLPQADLYFCTSIFHHWVRIYGANDAMQMMQEIAYKTTRYLIFETGQYDEQTTSWYSQLSFMGEDADLWIKQFLASLGFDEIVPLGQYETTVGHVKRTMYLAIKLSQ